MAGYTRVDTINNIADGNVINAADLDGEFDGIQAAFNSSTGHNHDGTAGEGAPILALGPAQDVTISTSVLGVKTTNTVDLGTNSLKFKDFYLAGNASVGGTLGVTGATTLSAALTYGGVTLNNAVTGTGNMVLSASPTLTGTLGAAAATFSGAVALNGNTTIGDADTDTITQAASYVTGTQLKSAKTATNTLSLAAYDVDGTAYTNLITLTASNTPTLALTSTGVGTINNMSIGATTASTGAFTTLSSTGNTTLGDASADAITVNGTTTFNASPIISVTDNTNAALRITQLGTGNALLVEDASNPDSTPFVIDASGKVINGYTATYSGLPATSAEYTQLGSIGFMQNGRFNAAASGPAYNTMKSRSTTIGSWAVVSSNDALGSYRFWGDDGSTFIESARIEAFVDGTPGTNDMPGRLVFSTTADGASTPTERMRIDSAGQVGMGTTPSAGSLLRLGGTFQASSGESNPLYVFGTAPTTATSAVNGVYTALSTADGITGLTNLRHFYAVQGTVTGGTRVAPTSQFGYVAHSSLTGATNNYGFYGDIASGTGRWNLYMNGTAANYFAGQAQFANGSVGTPSISNINDTNTGIFFPAADTIAFSEGGVESMRITPDGNVGIGVTPSATWSSSARAIQLGGFNSIFGYTNNVFRLANNAIFTASNETYGASSIGATYYQQYNGAHSWFNAASGTAGNAISWTQAMTLNSTGLGIGETSITSRLTVKDSIDLLADFNSTGTNGGYMVWRTSGTVIADIGTAQNIFGTGGSDTFGINARGARALLFGTNNTERIRITSGGEILFGKTAANTTGAGVYVEPSSINYGRINIIKATASGTGATPAIRFYYNGSVVGDITNTSTVTAYVTSSDYRLKNITGPITTSGEYIDSLNPVEGTWKIDGSTFVGLIAHEVQEASRTIVATGVKDGEDMQGMDYSSAEIIANLIAEVKSLRSRVTELEAK